MNPVDDRLEMPEPSPADPRSFAPPGGTIPDVFAEQAARHPDRTAVVEGGRILTYHQLLGQCRRLAAAIRDASPGGGTTSAILASHGADLIIAMLASLEAGRLTVVLDPADPPIRLEELLRESESVILLTDAANAPLALRLATPGIRLIGIGDETAAPDTARSDIDRPRPEASAFILFTSGSTGRAKGVLATHANIVRNVRTYADSVAISPEDRMTLLSRCQYMSGLSATFGALLHGAALLPFDVRSRGFREMQEWMRREEITVYHSVPSLFRRFCESLAPGTRFPTVRIVKLGGEQVMNHDVKLWRRHFPEDSILVNGLGLSEANGNLCHFRIDRNAPQSFTVVPVGRPLPGVSILLLDDSARPVEAGEVGEIAFRCPHRSPGYWRSDQFAERLVPPPSPDASPEPYFRTGDLGRMRADGCLEHLGRMDALIKLRGLRIEPAQIEAALFEHPRIRQCVVGVRGEGSRPRQLVAWFAAAPDAEPTPEELREHLTTRLPPGLVPNRFVSLTEMPTTPGGKIDRRALPDPAASGRRRTGHDALPRNVVEQRLAKLWRKVLRVRSVAPSDDFFALGGDSLSAAVLLSRIEEILDADLEPGDFLACPTLEAMAGLVQSVTGMEVHRRLLLTRSGCDPEAEPFFFVPGAGVALKTPRRDVAAGRRPFYRLQYQGLDGVERPQGSVGEMAAYFVREIRFIQPQGPYAIGGGSFGGLVAFEAAHRLREAGEEVALLVIVDTLLDGCLTPKQGLPWRRRLERALLGLMPVGRRIRLTRAGARDGIRQWRHRAIAPLVGRFCRLTGRSVPKIHRSYDLLNQCVAAKRRYVPHQYDGAVALLRTAFREADRLFDLEPTLGWSRWCPNLQRHDLEGDKGDREYDPERKTEFIALVDTLIDAATSEPTREGSGGRPGFPRNE